MHDISRGCSGCLLEREGAFLTGTVGGAATGLEAERSFLVLLRIENGRLDRVRPLSWSCGIDVGGKPLHWLDGVAPADSLRFLGSLVASDAARGTRGRKHGDEGEGLLAAIAFHDHPAADALLEGWVGPGQPEERRRQAAFWMGNARGRRGYETLRRLAREDASPKFREHAVFALSQSDVPEAVDVILGRRPERRGAPRARPGPVLARVRRRGTRPWRGSPGPWRRTPTPRSSARPSSP